MSPVTSRLRYAFAVTRGLDAGRRCGGCRIWTHRQNTYITAKTFGGVWKTSLHADESWRLAVTSEHEKSGNQPVVPGGRRDTPWKFSPTEFDGGGRLAFVVAVTRNSLIPQPIDPRETVIEVEDRWDRMTMLYVWMTEPGVTLESPGPVGGPLLLLSGRQVWVTSGDEVTAPYEPEPMPAGLMIQPLSPGKEDQVSAPGFLVRGMNIG
jgi:hypothetical protein